MTDTSRPPFELKEKLDQIVVEIIRTIASVCEKLNIRFFLAGAVARDLVLANIFGRSPGRKTNDLDFAFAVGSWEQYEQLKSGLLATGSFSSCANKVHRLFFHCAEGVEFIVDLIPFGRIAEQNQIAWPPNQDTIMNVAGFEEALASAIPVRINDSCILLVASLPGLALLKLLAWKDRHGSDNRDAADFLKIVRDYADAGNEDRLFEKEPELLEVLRYDTVAAGATLLGRDAALIATDETKQQVQDLLTTEKTKEALLRQMIQALGLSEEYFGGTTLLDRFTEGFFGR
ncbi:MAG TPA: hypothetical protein VKW78_08350 [Terriglobales bacterium]|nr:hypothetical protein [Terriglobales bacterium]